jgi:integrase
VREVPLLDRAYEALVAQLRDEQAKGLGNGSDYVFTSLTGRPLGRDRISKRGVLGAARKAGLELTRGRSESSTVSPWRTKSPA